MSVLADKTLTCRDCGRTFPFTVREQEFYAQKGFNNEPSRCAECRAVNKARLNGGVAPTPPPSFDRPDRQMYPAVCATCGKATQVPFEPRSGRPVYCRDCFVPRAPSPAGSFDRGSHSAPSFGSGPSLDRGSGFGSGGPPDRSFEGGRSRDRGASFGTPGGRGDRGPAFGSTPPGERRGGAGKSYDRRASWTASYEVESDGEGEEEFDSPDTRRTGKKGK